MKALVLFGLFLTFNGIYRSIKEKSPITALSVLILLFIRCN